MSKGLNGKGRLVIWTDHGRMEAERRSIDFALAEEAVREPQQKVDQGRRVIFQRRYYDRDLAKEMPVRVVVEPLEDMLTIITVYKTSRIRKYWQS